MTTPATPALSFERLVTAIGQAHVELAAQASRAVNASLTPRNWLIGLHIAEYEQQGTDRAQYGDKLIERLSDRLIKAGVSRAEARELRRDRQFYLTYPPIWESVTPKLVKRLLPQSDAGNNRESLASARALGETTIRHMTSGEFGSSEVDHGCREDAPATQPPPHAPRGRANNRPQVPFAYKLVLNQWLPMEGA